MYNLGTSGWYYTDWIGEFYPEDIEKNQWLTFYAKYFNTVEVNASFYRLPFKNMINGWNNKTPKDFLLTFKGSRIITHSKKLNQVEEYLKRFFERIKLTQKIGVILWQLPPNLKKDINLLEKFINLLDPKLRQCIEFRHESWFDEEVYTILKKYEIGFCIISAPELPSVIKITSDFAYIRWHGIKEWYKYNYSKDELRRWAKIIKNMQVDDIFGYFNNDFDGNAPRNCTVLKELLQ